MSLYYTLYSPTPPQSALVKHATSSEVRCPAIHCEVHDGWGLYNANNKNHKKTTVHNPKRIPEKIKH